MDKCCKLYGCANGQGISLTSHSEYLERGLLTIQSSGEPVTYPDKPTCYLCLNDKRGHYLAILQEQLGDAEYEKNSLELEVEECKEQLEEAQYYLEKAGQRLREARDQLAAEGVQLND